LPVEAVSFSPAPRGEPPLPLPVHEFTWGPDQQYYFYDYEIHIDVAAYDGVREFKILVDGEPLGSVSLLVVFKKAG
jgi:hypothetical protein